MMKVIPGRIENGHVVPDYPLPPTGEVERVSIMVETRESPRVAGEPSTYDLLAQQGRGQEGDTNPAIATSGGFLSWFGVLKGTPVTRGRTIVSISKRNTSR